MQSELNKITSQGLKILENESLQLPFEKRCTLLQELIHDKIEKIYEESLDRTHHKDRNS